MISTRRRLPVRGRRAGVPRRSRAQLASDASRSRPATSGAPARSNGCPTTSTDRAAFRSSTSREPLWDQPGLAEESKAGRYYLPEPDHRLARDDRHVADRGDAAIPAAAARARLDAVPRGGLHRGLLPAADRQARDARRSICGVLARRGDPGLDVGAAIPSRCGRVEIGRGIKVPTYVSGPLSHSWWAMVVLMLVAGSLYLAYVFSYLYLWTVSPQVWPKPAQLPLVAWPLLSALLLAASSGLFVAAGRAAARRPRSNAASSRCWPLAVVALVGGLGVEAARTGAPDCARTPTRTPRWSTWRRSCSSSSCSRSS